MINEIFRTLPMRPITRIRKPITCKDGFEMSVQAGHLHYCEPRVDGAPHYTEFEVGYPSEAEPLLMEYADEPSDPTYTVYARVPAAVIDAIIAKHGGI